MTMPKQWAGAGGYASTESAMSNAIKIQVCSHSSVSNIKLGVLN